jgi:hypothetical protein
MPSKFVLVVILVILLVGLIGVTGCDTCRVCGIWVEQDNPSVFIQFFDNGRYWNGLIGGTWTADGNRITVATPLFGATTLTLQGDKLTLDGTGDVYVRSGGESQVTEPPVNNNHTTQSVITSVSIIYPTQTQTITITGHGFGQHNPYNGNSEYISVSDLTHPWSAGYLGSAVTLNVTSWSDTQIVISGFTGQYGKQGWALYSGDSIQITLWVTPDSTRPVTYKTIVSH